VRWTKFDSSEPGQPVPGRAMIPAGGFWESLRRVLPAARTAMEYCWLYPWIVVVGGGLYGPAGPLIGPGWALLLLVGGQITVRPILARVDWLPRARAVLVGVGLLLGFVAVHEQHYPGIPLWSMGWIAAFLQAAHDTLPAVPKPALGALVAACLWWRGLALGVREPDAFAIEAAYKTGVGMIALYFIAAAVYADAQGFVAAGPALPGSLLAFFFLGLSALALARLAVIWDRGQPDERAHFSARAWVLLVVGVVGMILLAASMSAGLAAADVATYVGLVLRPLLPVVEVLFLALFFVAGILVRIIIAVLSHIPRRDIDPLQPPPPTAFDELLRRLREINMNPQVIHGARWMMVAAVALGLAIGMAVTIALMRRRERKTDEDEHESVWSAQELWSGLARRLRLRSRPAAPERAAAGVHSIRRVYRDLLQVGRTLGAPRPPWATPREHQPALTGVLFAAADDVAVITDAYERVRYGPWTPAEASVGTVKAALVRIRAAVARRNPTPE
jgi:hypothetical protein